MAPAPSSGRHVETRRACCATDSCRAGSEGAEIRVAKLQQDEHQSGTFVSADARADVAVVLVTYNNACDIPQLIDDLRVEALDRPVRLIVVDNQSSDGTVDAIQKHEDIVLVESGG